MFKYFLLLLFALFSSSIMFAQDTIVDKYLPELKDWDEKSREIYLSDDLFFLIDGGAELYIEYGFDQVVSARMQNPQGENATIELYKMKDVPAAYGIYSFNSKTGNEAGVAEQSILGKDYLMFRKSDIFGMIRMSNASDEELKQIALLTAGNIPETDSLSPFIRHWSGFGDFHQVYIEGSIALNNFYYFGYQDIFNLQQAIVLEKENKKFIIIKYDDAAKRDEILGQATSALESSEKFNLLHQEELSTYFTDRNNKTIGLTPVNEYLIISITDEPAGNEIHQLIKQQFSN